MSNQTSNCWNWGGTKNSCGYGVLKIYGKQVYAHRWFYEEFRQEKLPSRQSGLCLDHLCQNRACVNPAHLELVTLKENIMRGNCIPAINSRKIHCPQGHKYIFRWGKRVCWECVKANGRKYYRQKMKLPQEKWRGEYAVTFK